MGALQYTPIELLERLVAFDTTSRNCNLEMIDFIENYLASHAVSTRRFDHVPGCKTNLFATLGPANIGGIVLSGHTDVVPIDGQSWSSDPFRLTERGSRLYGRGACDMKGFIAVALALIPELKIRRLRTPLHLALSCDEEVGCRGVAALISGIRAAGPLPKLAIIGEPSSMRVLDAHKGTMTFVTEVTGAAAHSSDPAMGVNAITYAARLIGAMESAARDLRTAGDPSGRFAPPYTTLHVGVISGGTVKNVVPEHCTITWEMRPLPGADIGPALESLRLATLGLEREMQGIVPGTSIITKQTNAVPALNPAVDGRARAFMLKLAGAVDAGAASFASEAGHFQVAGVPAVICGPGSIEQAHKPDEFIERADLERCAELMRRLGAACESEILL